MADKKDKSISIDFYLSKYLVPVSDRKWLLVFSILGFFLFSFAVSLFIKPEFTSMGTVLVEEPRSNSSSSVSKDVGPRKADSAYVIAETEKIQSESFAEEVFNIIPGELKTDLETQLGITSQLSEGLKEAIKNTLGKGAVEWFKKMTGKDLEPASEYLKKRSLLMELQRRVTVTSNANRAMIWISARTLKKELAPVLVKSYMDVWMAVNLEENKKEIRGEREFSELQREETFKKFTEAERELIEFKKKYEIPAELKVAPDLELQQDMERLHSRLEFAKDRFNFMDKIYLETRRKEGGVVNNIRILNAPAIPLRPSKSSGNKIILLGTLAGLLLGMGIVFATDFLKGFIRHEFDVTGAVDIPIMGHIPKI